jgi:hypothetical protein
MSDNSDPTKDPKFKQVVDHFLKTPPKPHKRKKDEQANGQNCEEPRRRSEADRD